MALPPGLLYLAPLVPQLLAPPTVVYLASYLARNHLGVVLPAWTVVLTYVLCWPLALTVYVQWRDFKLSRDAAALGAVLPPMVETKRIGGMDLLKKNRIEADKHILGMYVPPFSFCIAHVRRLLRLHGGSVVRKIREHFQLPRPLPEPGKHYNSLV